MKIRKITVGILTFVFAILLAARGDLLAAPPLVEKLEKTPLPRIKVPAIQKMTLKNGMRLLMLPDDETPVVNGYIYVRTGSLYEPANRLGLAAITGQLLRSGGTQKLPPDQFNEVLARLGAEVQTGINREYGFVAFQCLAEDFPEVLGLVFQMLRKPAFDPHRLQLAKMRMIEQLRRQNDQPEEIAKREFPKIIYGKKNVWARTPTRKTVQAITREDVIKFYKRFYYPDRMIMALSGDFSKNKVLKEVKKVSQGWGKAPKPLPKVPPLQKTWEEGVYFVQKGIDQATLVLGHYGEQRFNPDKFALILLNDILGGNVLGSRLGKRIRSSLGLAYGIWSSFGLQTDYGIFYVFAQTKAGSAREVLKEVRKILKEIVSGETLNAAELEEHKQSVVNSLYSQYEPRFNFVKDEARFEYLGYPPNYLEIFRKKIQQVTLKDIRRVAQKYLRPDALQVLVVGDQEKIGDLPGAKVIPLENI